MRLGKIAFWGAVAAGGVAVAAYVSPKVGNVLATSPLGMAWDRHVKPIIEKARAKAAAHDIAPPTPGDQP